MSILKFTPTVFVVDDEYEIVIVSEKNSIIAVNIWGKEFYEENSGVLSSEKNYAKIRVPQALLNRAGHYFVVCREAINRKGYFSEIGEPETQKFEFKPLKKTSDIHVYHVADVHYNYEVAAQAATYFGDDTDLYIFNGDIGEVETVENYYETLKFAGDVTGGKVPAIFTRGNHDARGKLAEKYTEYFPAVGKNVYFAFSVGCLNGLVLDCGEDKADNHTDYAYKNPHVYNGVNRFSEYRQKELNWLRKTNIDNKDNITFAISHICPSMATTIKNSCSDIEHECYMAWNKELERMNVKFMICGHIHNAMILYKDSEKNILPHEYPIVIGSKLFKEKYVGGRVVVEKYYGTALTINPDKIEVAFTDQNHEILEKHIIKI